MLFGATIKPNGKISACFNSRDDEVDIASLDEILKQKMVPYSKVEIRQRLMDNEIELNLSTAAIYGLNDDLRLHIKRNPSQASLNECLKLAIENGQTDSVKILISESKADPAYHSNFPIRFASINDDLDTVKFLLNDKRVDPTAEHNEALMAAVEYNNIEVVKLLLNDPRIDPTDNDNFAIRTASDRGYTELMKILLANDKISNTMKLNVQKKSYLYFE